MSNNKKDANQTNGAANESDNKSRIRVRVNRDDMVTTYANGFHPLPTADELFIDFGVNLPEQPSEESGPDVAAQIHFDVSHRIAMNYTTAKQLAIQLGRLVQTYEKDFGEIALTPSGRKRTKETQAESQLGDSIV
ncbi:MAG: DUF3467 domain-containing protein [Pseudomonadota bacterium]